MPLRLRIFLMRIYGAAVMHHRGTENTEILEGNRLTGEVIGAAIEIHRVLGPGLLSTLR